MHNKKHKEDSLRAAPTPEGVEASHDRGFVGLAGLLQKEEALGAAKNKKEKKKEAMIQALAAKLRERASE
jgi:hypothetical protein